MPPTDRRADARIVRERFGEMSREGTEISRHGVRLVQPVDLTDTRWIRRAISRGG
jgi:hypothetical protein